MSATRTLARLECHVCRRVTSWLVLHRVDGIAVTFRQRSAINGKGKGAMIAMPVTGRKLDGWPCSSCGALLALPSDAQVAAASAAADRRGKPETLRTAAGTEPEGMQLDP